MSQNQISYGADLSYIRFQGIIWYLATIEDIFTRVIIGYQMGKFHNSELVMTTIKQAIQFAGTTPDIFHSDQGTVKYKIKLCNITAKV
ncbi:MAG: hypothetical protein A3D75_00715 [Candidatus Levybacteria bacterium RIFCSPHIGHO2_02_FULL_37_18]|nr:MAG: hypothetical protein A3D75_00715 [Candidatus Levybacteria bacterium RIFCSPHIGHO2_02_FULL_37_18]